MFTILNLNPMNNLIKFQRLHARICTVGCRAVLRMAAEAIGWFRREYTFRHRQAHIFLYWKLSLNLRRLARWAGRQNGWQTSSTMLPLVWLLWHNANGLVSAGNSLNFALPIVQCTHMSAVDTLLGAHPAPTKVGDCLGWSMRAGVCVCVFPLTFWCLSRNFMYAAHFLIMILTWFHFAGTSAFALDNHIVCDVLNRDTFGWHCWRSTTICEMYGTNASGSSFSACTEPTHADLFAEKTAKAKMFPSKIRILAVHLAALCSVGKV